MNIIITGGSRGMGRAIIKRLHTKHTCIAIARPSADLDLIKSDFNCPVYGADVAKAEELTHTIQKIVEAHGPIDVLINSAGLWIEGALETNDLSTIEQVVAVNVLGTMYAARAVIPHMKEREQGFIINIGSQSGLKTKGERSVYGATKWAITGFSRALNEELGPHNIRVTSMYPGTTDTPFFSRAGSNKDLSKALNAGHIAEAVEWLIQVPPHVNISDFGIKATFRG